MLKLGNKTAKTNPEKAQLFAERNFGIESHLFRRSHLTSDTIVMYGEAVEMLYYIDFKPYKIEPFVSSLTPVTKMLITSYFSNVLISCLLNKLFNLITYV